MAEYKVNSIHRDDEAVKVLAASARGERIDTDVRARMDEIGKDIMAQAAAGNGQLLAEYVDFVVEDFVAPAQDFLNQIADVKRVGDNQTLRFRTEMEGVHAYVQAADATTPRSRITSKMMTLTPVVVSVRPVVNRKELKNGTVDLAHLVQLAGREMENAILGEVGNVLWQNYVLNGQIASPYYQETMGLAVQPLKAAQQHMSRFGGGATLIGDIYMVGQLGELTGFTAATGTQQFADALIYEQNQNGYIGRWNGSDVIQLNNYYKSGSDTETVIDDHVLFIVPNAISPDMRPLKVGFVGGVDSMNAQNIDDMTMEIRMDQEVGVGIVYGDRPYMAVIRDTTM